MRVFVFSFLVVCFSCSALKGIVGVNGVIDPYQYTITKKVVANKGAVASAHPLASRVGIEVMRSGGNAFDAAVATQFALAVVYPNAGNLGGGGFLVARTAAGE